jgi:hypothetical protein
MCGMHLELARRRVARGQLRRPRLMPKVFSFDAQEIKNVTASIGKLIGCTGNNIATRAASGSPVERRPEKRNLSLDQMHRLN